MSSSSTVDRRVDRRRLLGWLALFIACLGLVKYLVLLVEGGPAKSPWFFLIAFVVPFVAGKLLLPAHPRAGATLIGLCSAALATICVIGAAAGVGSFWPDYLVVYVAGPAALVALVVAGASWPRGSRG